MTRDDAHVDPFEQRARLEAILAAHADPAGAIPAAAVPALTANLGQLLDAVRSSGTAGGYEEAISQD